jgi:hypothetical protein
MDLDTSRWSGEGEFTALLIERLRDVAEIAAVHVEDAPATRAEADYNFVSNELFITFHTKPRRISIRRLGFWPGSATVLDKTMDVAGLERTLTGIADIGPPDYGDDGMLQYLKTETVIQPYQTRGYKLIELVRIYEAGSPRRSS